MTNYSTSISIYGCYVTESFDMSKIALGEHIIIDSQQRQVTAFGEKLNIPERNYRLLLKLVENAPNIVSHNELIKAVWKETVVSDESLKQRISRLRKQLIKADKNASEYFVAERGLGYRCNAPIKILQPAEQKQEPKLQSEQQPQKIKDENQGTDRNSSEQITQQQELAPYNLTMPQSLTNKSHLYLWLLPLFTVIIILLFFNNNFNQSPDTQPSAPSQSQNQASDSIAAQLTPDDFEKQARQYYYRFNSTANDTAIGLYRQAINLDPNYAMGYFGLGNTYAQGYYQYGKPYQWLQQSLQYSKQAIEIAPQQTWGYKSLGLGLYLDGKYIKSIENYQKANELADWWASPINNMALAQMEIGQLLPAYQNASKAIAIDPKDPIPYLFLGLVYRDLAMTGHADKAIGRAVNFMPDYNLAISYQAESLLVTGQYQQAIDTANKAITTNFDNQLAYWVIAHAWLAQANVTKSKEALQKAADIGGRYTPIVMAYLAILNGQPLDDHQMQLLAKIEQGNQWFEYPLALAAIKAVNNEKQQSLEYLQNALDSGLNHPIRLKITPFFKKLTEDPNTNKALLSLIEQLEDKITKQRQKVIQMEQSKNF